MTSLAIQRAVSAGALVLCMAAPAAGQGLPAPLSQSAPEWMVIDRTDYGTISLDTAHVLVVEQDVFEVRTHWGFAREQSTPAGARFDSSVAQRVVNCRTQEIGIVSYWDLEGEEVVHAVEQPLYATRWSAVPPGSVVHRIATLTCELGRRNSRVARTTAFGG